MKTRQNAMRAAVLTFLAAMLGGSTPTFAKVPVFGASGGLGEYLNVPGPPVHAGVYASLGLYMSIDLGRATLTFQAAAEVAPEFQQWGFIPTITLDIPVHKRFGIDAAAMLMHNQTNGDWQRAEVLVGGGPGVSLYLPDNWMLSPNAMVLYNIMTGGVALFPGIGVSKNFD